MLSFQCILNKDYGGANTFVGGIYSWQNDISGYLPVQDLKRPTVGQLHPDLQPIGLAGKLTRIEGWAEARAFSHALSLVNFSFEELKVPQGLIARPLMRNELRVANDAGAFFIYNKDKKEFQPEIPFSLQLDKVKAILSVSDQGASNRSALHFLAYGPTETKLMLGLQWDPFHRCWNDLKAAMKKCGFWRMVLSLSVSYNLPYGPFTSGQWHSRKLQAARDFFEHTAPHDEAFTSYVPYISWELNQPEPSNNEELVELWEKVQDAPHWNCKGPLVKLMRWLNFFQSANYYKGDHFALKMVLTHGDLKGMDGSSDEDMSSLTAMEQKKVLEEKSKSARAELQELKKKKGNWAVAAKVLTKANIQQKDILCIVCRAACTHHSEEARELLTADQIQAHSVKAATGQGWAQELVLWLLQYGFLPIPKNCFL